ncbi:MAG: 6-carboxyhexanoate--CoA ligase [Nitrospirae bacterium]|nr:6-carboxyhexanoate--CoA ligase [Nitrospirota bacterium]
MRASREDVHISGAEGIFEKSRIDNVVRAYIERAYSHSRGMPDRVVITIEELKESPLFLKSLPVYTVDTKTKEAAWNFIKSFLFSVGVSMRAFENALMVVQSDIVMRGASIMTFKTGRRCEPDTARGIRATRLGITPQAEEILFNAIDSYKLNRTVVSEAIVLATKVAAFKDVIAELCVSDDPDYTTGYVSSKRSGYLRVPNIKEEGDRKGGRVIFVSEDVDINGLIRYLENTPVVIDSIGEFKGIVSPDEAIPGLNN